MNKGQDNIDVKERILNVARDLFIKHGYNGTSIRDIATTSGTNVAMVNYYYRSKYNLFEIIFNEAFDILIERVFKAISSDVPFFDLVKLWIHSYYDILNEYPQIPIFILNEINQNPEKLTERIKSRNPVRIFERLEARLETEVKNGTIRETPPINFALSVLSLCVFPYMFGTLAIKVTEKTLLEYNAILNQHKEFVVNFVTNALKP